MNKIDWKTLLGGQPPTLAVVGIFMIISGVSVIFVMSWSYSRGQAGLSIDPTPTPALVPTPIQVSIATATLTPFPTPYPLTGYIATATYSIRPTSTPPPSPRIVIVYTTTLTEGDRYIVLLNPSETLIMKDWVIFSGRQSVYTFQNFIFHEGSAIRIHLGDGENTQTDIFVGTNNLEQEHLLNSSVLLKDQTGSVIDELIIGSSSE